MYASWDMAHNRQMDQLKLWLIEVGAPPKKTPGDVIILQLCTRNYKYMMYSSWDMVCNGWADGLMEKVTYRGGCPTSKIIKGVKIFLQKLGV